MQIIAEARVQQRLLTILQQQVVDDNIIIVDLESIYAEHQTRSGVYGLVEALKVVNDGKPIILLGWQEPLEYSTRIEWHALMGYPHVMFFRHPLFHAEALTQSITEAKNGSLRPADPLAIRLLQLKAHNDVLQVLRHDLHYAEMSQESMEAWLPRARQHFGNLSEQELVALVKDTTQPKLGPLAGLDFQDVCVDIEGTLIDKQGKLRIDVVDKVCELSQGRPVTVWTGGNMKELDAIIRKQGLDWKLTSKNLLRGAKVHTIVDDLDQEEFNWKYGVACDTYIQIPAV
jgi:hypothetical protein